MSDHRSRQSAADAAGQFVSRHTDAAHRQSSLRRYLAIYKRRRIALTIAFVLPIIAAIVVIVTSATVYEGTAQVVLARQNLANVLTNTPDPAASANDFIAIVQTQAAAARSQQVAGQVLQAVPHSGLSVQGFLDNSSASPVPGADVLQFGVQNHDARLAQVLANSYAHEFTVYRRDQDTSALASALAQIDQRIAQLNASPKGGGGLTAGLIDKDQQLRTLEALQTANATVINPTTTASVASPRKALDIAIGILGGLILTLLVGGLLEALDTRVRNQEDIEDLLALPFLGRVSPPPPEAAGGLISLIDPSHISVESFRILRTNLEFQTLVRHEKVIMVTSSIESEGKSVTIANLAVAAARAGRHVVVIDMDLRRPRLPDLFGTEAGRLGLTDVAVGRASLDEALIDVDLSGHEPSGARVDSGGRLQLLVTGALPPDPGEFVASENAAAIVREVAAHADLVLVDCPPVLRAGDAMAISRMCDGLFVVARLRVLRRRMLQDLGRALASSRARPLGVVVTGPVTGADERYGYGYGYGYRPGDAPPATQPVGRNGSSGRGLASAGSDAVASIGAADDRSQGH